MIIIIQWIGAVLMLLGGLLAVVAALGMLMLPDPPARLQAAAKPQVVALVLIVVGAAPFIRWWPALGMLLLVAAFQMITTPVLTQLLARSSYRAGTWRRDRLLVDEYAEDLEPDEHEDVTE